MKSRKTAPVFMRNSPLYVPMLAILTAVELVLAFSAFGYIIVPPVSLTFMTLPVLVGAMLFGPAEGLFLGCVFGLTSLWKASVTATAHADQIFSPLISGSPVSSLLLSVGTRMLFGFLAGCLFLAVRKMRWKKTGIVLAACLADFLHSMLVLHAMQFLFPDVGFTLESGFSRQLSLGRQMSRLVVGLLVLAVYLAAGSRAARGLDDELGRAEKIAAHPHALLGLGSLISLMFLLAIGLLHHFYGRTEILLRQNGVVISPETLSRFWQLGTQFLVALVALFLIVGTVLMLLEKYLLEMAQQAKRDMMTGLYNKMTLTRHVDSALSGSRSSGFLLLLDVDNFKRLNDTYGHPAGDRVLVAVAGILQDRFGRCGIVGRLGGDEFAVYAGGMSAADMRAGAEFVCRSLTELTLEGVEGVSCSIGIAFCAGKQGFSDAYSSADQALYRAKGLGKNRYAFEERPFPVEV